MNDTEENDNNDDDGEWEDMPDKEKSKPKQNKGTWKETVCEVCMVVGNKSLSIMRIINTFIGKLLVRFKRIII